jgi:hypothetical protein
MQRQKAVRSSEITLMMLGPHPEEHSPVFDAAEIVWVHSYAATNAKGEYHVAFGIGDDADRGRKRGARAGIPFRY